MLLRDDLEVWPTFLPGAESDCKSCRLALGLRFPNRNDPVNYAVLLISVNAWFLVAMSAGADELVKRPGV